MVFGTFDLLHPGHINFLRQAKKHGQLTVVIARDKTVRRLKGRFPLHAERKRQLVVKNLNLAAKVILGSLTDKYAAIKKYQPDLIALGYDQRYFTDQLKEKFKKIKIVRLKAFKPNKFKTSFLKLK